MEYCNIKNILRKQFFPKYIKCYLTQIWFAIHNNFVDIFTK